MHDLNFIAQNIEFFKKMMRARGLDEIDIIDVESLPSLYKLKNNFLTECQGLEAKNNDINKNFIPENKKLVSSLKKSNPADASIAELEKEITQKIEIVKGNNDNIASLKTKIEKCEARLKGKLENYPNIPLCTIKDSTLHIHIPIGLTEHENCQVASWGQPRQFDFEPKSHEEVVATQGYIETEQTAKISGARFVTLMGKVALLERALIEFMLDMHLQKHGYSLVSPPYLVKDSTMFGVGQLPKFSTDSFEAQGGSEPGQPNIIKSGEGYRMIPTAEVPLTSLVADKILSLGALPLRYVAVTPCFRSEAGSSGRDTKGLIRLHQFTKIELVSITDSTQLEKILANNGAVESILNGGVDACKLDQLDELHRMTNCARAMLEALEIPYRIIDLCTGDMGFSARKTYDIEAWFPSQQKYREISSCSYCGDFQGRRMNGRYKSDIGKNTFLHTFNGSALPLGRTIAAIIENFQLADGDFEWPKVLKRPR